MIPAQIGAISEKGRSTAINQISSQLNSKGGLFYPRPCPTLKKYSLHEQGEIIKSPKSWRAEYFKNEGFCQTMDQGIGQQCENIPLQEAFSNETSSIVQRDAYQKDSKCNHQCQQPKKQQICETRSTISSNSAIESQFTPLESDRINLLSDAFEEFFSPSNRRSQKELKVIEQSPSIVSSPPKFVTVHIDQFPRKNSSFKKINQSTLQAKRLKYPPSCTTSPSFFKSQQQNMKELFTSISFIKNRNQACDYTPKRMSTQIIDSPKFSYLQDLQKQQFPQRNGQGSPQRQTLKATANSTESVVNETIPSFTSQNNNVSCQQKNNNQNEPFNKLIKSASQLKSRVSCEPAQIHMNIVVPYNVNDNVTLPDPNSSKNSPRKQAGTYTPRKSLQPSMWLPASRNNSREQKSIRSPPKMQSPLRMFPFSNAAIITKMSSGVTESMSQESYQLQPRKGRDELKFLEKMIRLQQKQHSKKGQQYEQQQQQEQYEEQQQQKQLSKQQQQQSQKELLPIPLPEQQQQQELQQQQQEQLQEQLQQYNPQEDDKYWDQFNKPNTNLLESIQINSQLYNSWQTVQTQNNSKQITSLQKEQIEEENVMTRSDNKPSTRSYYNQNYAQKSQENKNNLNPQNFTESQLPCSPLQNHQQSLEQQQSQQQLQHSQSQYLQQQQNHSSKSQEQQQKQQQKSQQSQSQSQQKQQQQSSQQQQQQQIQTITLVVTQREKPEQKKKEKRVLFKISRQSSSQSPTRNIENQNNDNINQTKTASTFYQSSLKQIISFSQLQAPQSKGIVDSQFSEPPLKPLWSTQKNKCERFSQYPKYKQLLKYEPIKISENKSLSHSSDGSQITKEQEYKKKQVDQLAQEINESQEKGLSFQEGKSLQKVKYVPQGFFDILGWPIGFDDEVKRMLSIEKTNQIN